jgi:hypothetical protein
MIAELAPAAALPIPAHVCAVTARLASTGWQEIDAFEAQAATLPQVELPLRHVFTPGLYTRQIFMPAGTLLTSRIHLFEHPFVIAAGVVSVWGDETGWQTYRAPYLGVTLPATRRVLYIHEDTTWMTFHVTTETDPDKVVLAVTFTGGKYKNLGGAAKQDPLKQSLPSSDKIETLPT